MFILTLILIPSTIWMVYLAAQAQRDGNRLEAEINETA